MIRGYSLRNATTLIKMYGKCGSLEQARNVFDKLQGKDIVCWTAMITAYAQNGQCREALQIYLGLESQGLQPDAFTFTTVLDACASVQDLSRGKAIHSQIRKSGLESTPAVANALINMYARCGRLDRARQTFDSMRERDVISWNTIISAYAREEPDNALKLYREMDLPPTSGTFVAALSACSSLKDASAGRSIRKQLQARGLQENPLIVSSLIELFASCKWLDEARKVFDEKRLRSTNVWSSIISAYSRLGHFLEALNIFREMISEGIRPDAMTFVTALNACSSLKDLELGRWIHQCFVNEKLEEENVFVGNSLVNLYGKCGCLSDARRVFESMKKRDVISWNSIICSYRLHGENHAALELFRRMDLEPEEISFHSAIDSCAAIGDLELGRAIHSRIQSPITEWIAAALVNLYCSCGRFDEALGVLTGGEMTSFSSSSWTMLMAAQARNGESLKALELFREMELQGGEPDSVTYSIILSSCSHAGLIEQGCCCFGRMRDDRGIEPVVEHYACVVDLLGRAGWIAEAGVFLMGSLPVEADEETYMALLAACRTHRDVEVGLSVAQRVLEMNPEHRGAYSLLHNMIVDLNDQHIGLV